MRNPALSHLRCITCSSEYPLKDLPAGCPACAAAGRPSSLAGEYRGLPGALIQASQGYTWGAWLPYLDGVSLGEGNTPCLELPRLAGELGLVVLMDNANILPGDSENLFNLAVKAPKTKFVFAHMGALNFRFWNILEIGRAHV